MTSPPVIHDRTITLVINSATVTRHGNDDYHCPQNHNLWNAKWEYNETAVDMLVCLMEFIIMWDLVVFSRDALYYFLFLLTESLAVWHWHNDGFTTNLPEVGVEPALRAVCHSKIFGAQIASFWIPLLKIVAKWSQEASNGYQNPWQVFAIGSSHIDSEYIYADDGLLTLPNNTSAFLTRAYS